MRIFLSRAGKDRALANELSRRLTKAGFQVWDPHEETLPGDNWAKKIGKALDESNMMVFLLTPRSIDSDWLRKDMMFALGSLKYENRVFSVLVKPRPRSLRRIPPILLELPHAQIDSAKDCRRVVKKIQSLVDPRMN